MSLHVGLNVVRGYIYHLCTANFDTFWGFPRPSPKIPGQYVTCCDWCDDTCDDTVSRDDMWYLLFT